MGGKIQQKGEIIIFNNGLNEAYTIYNVISWERIPDNSKYHHYRIVTEDNHGVQDVYEVPADTIVSLPANLQYH